MLFSESLFTVFSTTTTDESTSIPIAITKPPKLIRFADNSNCFIRMKVTKAAIGSESETTNDGFRYPSTVQFFQQKWRRQDQLHSTQKPVELIKWLIKF